MQIRDIEYKSLMEVPYQITKCDKFVFIQYRINFLYYGLVIQPARKVLDD